MKSYDDFVEEQFALSTAEEEKNYFTETTQAMGMPVAQPHVMPSGIYRVIDGELYRLVPGVPILE